MNASHTKPSRSIHFYQDTVIFQVEDTLYKVPKFRFTQGSPFFETMFMLPQGSSDADESSVEGLSDDNPIKLPCAVSRKDFHQFLETLYPPILDPRKRSKVEWISVLKIATLFEFYDIRTHAIEKVSSFMPTMTALEKVKLGQEYHIADMFLNGLKYLVIRQDALSEEESSQLGSTISSIIGEERERCRSDNIHVIASGQCVKESLHEKSLQIVFAKEFDEIARGNAADKEPDI